MKRRLETGVARGRGALLDDGRSSAGESIVEVLRVEPSFQKTLDCPGCLRPDPRRGMPPVRLTPQMFLEVLRRLLTARVAVREFDFQMTGQGVFHCDISNLTRIAMECYPGARIRVSTGGFGARSVNRLAREDSSDPENQRRGSRS